MITGAAQMDGAILVVAATSGGYAQKCVREEEAEKAAAILQLDYFAMLDFPDAGIYFCRWFPF